jgi:transposase
VNRFLFIVRLLERTQHYNEGISGEQVSGDRNSRLTAVREWLLERIAREPDRTLEEIRLVLAREQ